MRKLIMLLILLLPFNVLAYSEYIIPGGETLGIEVNSKGVVVVGYYEVDGRYINEELKIGDRITAVNGVEVNTTNELASLIEEHMVDSKIDITYLRNGKDYNTSLVLSLANGTYRTGLYVKSSVLGIGTLTYIDPTTNVYGVLGHSLNMSNTANKIEIKEGVSYNADVTSFTRSVDGNPGSKNADIKKDEVFGTIENNTEYGIFGKTKEDNNNNSLKVAKLEEVNLGSAYIRTTNVNNEIDEYEIKILEINRSNSSKNIYFEITDEELIQMSGGIVQGMSGSPIIQDNKIVGAITRVLVDDVNRGYGISIVTMLEEGDKLLNE